MRCLLLLVALHLGCGVLAAGPTVQEPRGPSVLAFSPDRYAILDCGAKVYVGRVVKRTRTSDEGDAFERGYVDFQVAQAIHGPEREDLVLPYAFCKRPMKTNWMSVWPNLDRYGDRLLLCIVVASAFDRQTPPPREDGVACQVRVLSGEDDPLVEEMRYVCSLHSVDDREFQAAVVRGKRDPRPGVVEFLAYGLVHRFAADPDRVVKSIAGLLETWDVTRRSSPGRAVVDRVEGAVVFAGRDLREPGQRRALFRALAEATRSPHKAARLWATRVLSRAAGWAGSDPSTVFSPSEIQALGERMARVSRFASDGDHDFAQAANSVARWLGVAPAER